MKCPMRISYWGESKESNCNPNCAWRMRGPEGREACAVAIAAEGIVWKPANSVRERMGEWDDAGQM